jgi:hypothetical protein
VGGAVSERTNEIVVIVLSVVIFALCVRWFIEYEREQRKR